MHTIIRLSCKPLIIISEKLTPFQIYSSPYQPEFCGWAFAYERDEDRYNPPSYCSPSNAQNPVPTWPTIDVMLTHGPPEGILDQTLSGDSVGCASLLRAAARCKPRLHCFGHIHEGWGAQRMVWEDRSSSTNNPGSHAKIFEDRSAYLDLSAGGPSPLNFGKETVFINAAIMNLKYRPRNAPWVVDIDLPSMVS